jgi:FemAB-related protein (PEP-CTERM system-associated)
MTQATLLNHSSLITFVEQQAKETFYFNQAWLDLISRLFGYEVIPLTTTNGAGEITGFLPLCYLQSPLTGRRLVSLPFSDYCPLLATDEVSANDLVNQAIALARAKRVKYLELRTGSKEVLAQHPDLVEGNLYVRWIKPLTTDTDAMWLSIERSVREKIKKAQRLGVQVCMAQDREEMEHYYRLNLLTRSKKHGMPAQARRYFYELWDTFTAKGAMQLWLAEYQGIIIASSISFASGTTVRCAYNSSDQRYLHLAPNHLLLWTAITWACTKGYQMLDIGRTACDNTGLMDFKRRWGTVQEPLPYYYYPRMAGLASTAESSWKYRLLTSCWKRLPLQVTGPLGGYLYKHMG